MPAPLGVRICPTVNCSRAIREIGHTVLGRCDDCIRKYQHEAFAAPASGPDRGVPPVLRSGPVAASVNERRPAA